MCGSLQTLGPTGRAPVNRWSQRFFIPHLRVQTTPKRAKAVSLWTKKSWGTRGCWFVYDILYIHWAFNEHSIRDCMDCCRRGVGAGSSPFLLTVRLLSGKGCWSNQVTIPVREMTLILARVQLGNYTLSKCFSEFQSAAPLAKCSQKLQAMELGQY